MLQRMDVQSLALFVRTCELRNIGAAARAIDLSPSVATRRIAALERQIGSRLLTRSTRVIELTAAGRLFLDWAQRALAELEATRDRIGAMQGKPEGLVRVACPEFIATRYLARFIAEFCQRYPAITISIITTDRTVNLAGEQFDLAIHAGDRPAGFLVGRKLWDIETVVCATPAYLARHGRPAHPRDLAAHRCVTHSIYNPRDWTFAEDGETIVQPIEAAVHSSSTMLLRALALADIGIIRTTRRMVADDLQSGALVELLADFRTRDGSEALETWIIFPERAMLARTRLVIDELTGFLTAYDRILHARSAPG